jgi:phosphatidylserine/phosphatidylglycerophosphate/cardiolipin synthase-like enzyme
MKVLIQPGDGVGTLVKAIAAARSSVEIVIFRFDQREIERALANAVQRGVAVHALIAHTNRAGEGNLRRLETRLLGYGVTVARTADDLVRYHGKLMIIDRRELHLLAFNMTYLDIEHSRSFGLVTRTRGLVREAIRLFEADVKRQPYEAGNNSFLVSPVNARKQLAAFLKSAKEQILIYDPEVSDHEMASLLEERAKAGVDVRIIGKTKAAQLNARGLGIRLHTRTIVRDANAAFLGSQSLRALELDARREVGILFRDRKAVHAIRHVFEEDWQSLSEDLAAVEPAPPSLKPGKIARKVAKAVAEELPPVAEVVEEVVKEMGAEGELELDPDRVQEIIKDAVKEAVEEAVEGAADTGT